MLEPLDKRLLQAVLQNAGVGLMIQDRARRIVLLNPAFEEITGWRWQEIGGKECPEVFKCRTSTGKCLMDNFCPGLKIIEKETQEISRELLINRRDGGEKWVEVTVSPIRAEGGEVEYIVSIFKDISEKKRYSEELLKTKTLATLGQLAAELAHEVKNPLNSINIQLHLIEKELGSTTDYSGKGIAELVSRTKEEIKRLNNLVNRCLSFSRPHQLYLQQEDLKSILEDLVGLIEPQANLAGIDVILIIETGLPKVMLDKERFKQALLNLLVNALEAMPDGGYLHLVACMEDDSVKLYIKDTGKGIPEEVKERIFELFYTTKKEGTGIGLPLAHNIIQAHGGSISFSSSSAGTEFVITLPITTTRVAGSRSGRSSGQGVAPNASERYKTTYRQGEK